MRELAKEIFDKKLVFFQKQMETLAHNPDHEGAC